MLNRARILVIDDDPLFRSLIVTLLRKEFIVSVAGEGSEGFYKALEHPPDVAIVDIQMPGWDGLKTLEAFRTHPALSRVKVVILTSDASKETVLAAIRGGADDYVIKTSFSKQEFSQKLERLLPDYMISPPQPEVEPPPPSAPTLDPEPATGSSTDDTASCPVGKPAKQGRHDHQALQEILDGWE